MVRKAIHRVMVLVAAVVSLGSCARVQEACGVVAEADSLRAVGQAFTDSVAIADAAKTLYSVRLFYPTDYAHANYYYGRLLRERGDHPAAMEAFLRAVHSRTRDYAIKGRSWSNIANMCRLAAEHELAYDIYERSAEVFLQAQNTTAYYYALNNMAYELAEAKLSIESLHLTNQIAEECANASVLTKLWETRADAYMAARKYDSVLFCVRQLQLGGNNEPTGILFMAKAFSYLGIQDSAVYYAQMAVERTHSWFDLNNAYYILANDDQSKDKEDVLQVAADRSDVQKLIEIRQGQLSQATQLLQQDLNRKPDLRWVYAIVGTLCVIAVLITLYVRRKRRQHRLISQQIEKAVKENDVLIEQHQQLEQQQSKRKTEILHEIEMYCQSLQNSPNIKKELCWNDYDAMCAIVNRRMFGLAEKLKSIKSLNEREIRLCVLVVIGNLRDKEMAEILCYGENSIRTIKSIASKKLGTTGRNLRSFLLEIAVLG